MMEWVLKKPLSTAVRFGEVVCLGKADLLLSLKGDFRQAEQESVDHLRIKMAAGIFF